jgi:hypothetical protein
MSYSREAIPAQHHLHKPLPQKQLVRAEGELRPKEIKLALEQRDLMPEGKRYIIPILIDECNVPSAFEKIQWLHMSET